jgi:hypothetical protein
MKIIKKHILIAIALFVCMHVKAQIEKGKILISSGSDITFASGNSETGKSGSTLEKAKTRYFALQFTIGGFLANNFAAGITIPVDYEKYEVDYSISTQSSYGFASFFRIYLSKSSVNPYITMDLGYLHSSATSGDYQNHIVIYNGLIMDGGLGITSSFTQNIAFDSQLTYGYSNLKNIEDAGLKLRTKAFGIKIGFTLLL